MEIWQHEREEPRIPQKVLYSVSAAGRESRAYLGGADLVERDKGKRLDKPAEREVLLAKEEGQPGREPELRHERSEWTPDEPSPYRYRLGGRCGGEVEGVEIKGKVVAMVESVDVVEERVLDERLAPSTWVVSDAST